MATLEKEFSKEVVKRDTLDSLKILRGLSDDQFQSLIRFFMSMLTQSDEEREERLDSMVYIKMLSEPEFETLIKNMERFQALD
ncbi:hypothetical protein COW36_14435 [bacterium (Candidatus Blackallbacteria) CG17_big_fil_post_rev_8_21_14_2_50_48_46]|uniref:Uncharacterized protein n=1 Tax=bacterium (Candidatus Blackallbacteria) CG17_big_fil_post_rev_8_21_14_2_50_48_46 TaxID=2014261 RepID=A0A2M7G3V3_9BACT|nr:MAG: hypothetical protein COW64_08960 [bacterium (Candidatus Blackallbacteria) CG18_big_fil_WC_8_21_14_2_50_49_26]PIW16158.1 MAG: hypothetical protein COW36_14435 [bacterium (Candidatus Blackallbacteria) CG17_big_fil_post_rev_8_21_14_2_50_48_46]PIW44245.1 MAG: hypothetical protein COW20_24765 [bacterium (Candidatus Blackallbacteria) CG13_big_fil_rev_8_21_14_2_50_49_14]